jgi:hypothetical protein
MTADRELTRDEYDTLEIAIQTSDQMKQLSSVKLRESIKAQSRLLEIDRDESLQTLLKLIPHEKERAAAMKMIDTYTQAIKRPLKPAPSRIVTGFNSILKGLNNDHQ